MGGEIPFQLAAYREAIAFLFQPSSLLIMVGGTILSLIVGLIPILNPMMTLPLALPFLIFLPKDVALLTMIALWASAVTSGGITAILINVPGTPVNAATLLDGFPMAQKGEANRAIGAAVTASGAGGVIPCFMALAMVPLVLPIVMAFRSPEMAMLVIMGLSFLAVLSGGSATRTIACGA